MIPGTSYREGLQSVINQQIERLRDVTLVVLRLRHS